jgi:hypothetical protein
MHQTSTTPAALIKEQPRAAPSHLQLCILLAQALVIFLDRLGCVSIRLKVFF